MKQMIGFSQFCDGFSGSYKDNFSYQGKRALYDYLERLEEDMGEEIEFDPIGLCCDYSEYASALDCIEDKGIKEFEPDEDDTEEEKEEAAIEWLQGETQVITFDGGIIVQDF